MKNTQRHACAVDVRSKCVVAVVDTHISTPDISSQDLILLIQIQNLYKGQSVSNRYRICRVIDRSTHNTDTFVIRQQMFDQPLLVRHGYTV
ncbi:hypothetical protein LSH36_6g07021 [Paralvinella palmiformis]|uniref:Uncharacterized protein n=1 Tax=Paralvinella palmiformis TaxID=53620 RepID=A0AAD9NIT3_9ANNE|nr:hypothetical protein LSH36_6g07021 [Paralvinella palmiformis]